MESGESGESGESRGRGGSARRGGGRDGGRDGRVRIAPGGLLFRFMTVGAVVDAVCDLYSGAGSGQSSTALSTSGDERWFNGGAVHSLALFNNGVTSLSGFRYLLHDLPPVFAAQLRWVVCSRLSLSLSLELCIFSRNLVLFFSLSSLSLSLDIYYFIIVRCLYIAENDGVERTHLFRVLMLNTFPKLDNLNGRTVSPSERETARAMIRPAVR